MSPLSTFWMRVLFAVLVLLWSGQGFAQESHTFTGRTMGTSYTIHIVPPPEFNPELFQSQIDAELDRINHLMSTYLETSELSRFNARQETDWFQVSPDTARVVQRALEIAELSGGKFDPTVGRLVRLWNFGPGATWDGPPEDASIQAAMESVGYKLVAARLDPPAIRKSHTAVELDLSAIAKGFGVDAVSRLLLKLGATNHLVEIGGEVRSAGLKNGGTPWRVAIESPEEQSRSIAQVIELGDASMATSGDYRNYFMDQGKRYSHTIDPHTGRPVTHELAAVTVLADDCMSADGFATALMALGPQHGKEFADRLSIAVIFTCRTTHGFITFLSKTADDKFRFVPPVTAHIPTTPWPLPFTRFHWQLIISGLALACGVAVLVRWRLGRPKQVSTSRGHNIDV